MRLIQFVDHIKQPHVGIVDNDRICMLHTVSSTYELAQLAFESNTPLVDLARQLASDRYEDYATLLSDNRVLVPLAHPDPYHTWITGTGLTHLGSAASRDAMHQKLTANAELTDTMKMFKLGVEGGQMQGDVPGAQPEWFYKGNGLMAVAPGHPLPSPPFALDAGEEPELVGIYVNDATGTPHRIGFAVANEFSDHQMERMNYLYLAHSKLRPCSYGPELLLGDLPDHLVGVSRIRRGTDVIWEKEFLTGEANMSHNLANLEHHHFKYDLFRQPGDMHVHFFGTAVISFADGIQPIDGDVFEIQIDSFGAPLRNPLQLILP
ncbi:AraD1 family protein [Fibrella aquatilis]|uniref:FAH family protein n=1 Tax=Fibrella aquatilis TaxID=2817059 RepID=A0A939K178_9BACT|nr:AraD1 family protein [Fibrella aquatilis]MBO0931990.1 FAH family protein [Fibrella aquatilis]